jgi:hypothetical protein
MHSYMWKRDKNLLWPFYCRFNLFPGFLIGIEAGLILIKVCFRSVIPHPEPMQLSDTELIYSYVCMVGFIASCFEYKVG